MESEKQVVRVAAYIRLSARELTQKNIIALTCFKYGNYVKQYQGWKFVALYWDEDSKKKTKRIFRVCWLSQMIAKPEGLMWFLWSHFQV